MIKILLIGCGYWGKNWYKTIKSSPHQLAGVVDPQPSCAIDEPVFRDFSEVDIDFTHAIVATEPSTHVKIVNTLPIPHENILVEKPCGLNQKEGLKLNKCFPGYIFLHSAPLRYIQKNISKIGLPQYWRSTRASMGPRIRTDVSILEDYLIHDLYLYKSIFGQPEISESIFEREFKPPVKPSSINLFFKSPVPASLYSSWNYPIKERKLIIKGDQGSFVWENDDLYFSSSKYITIDSVDDLGNQGYELKDSPLTQINLPRVSNLELELDAFLNRPEKFTLDISKIWSIIDNCYEKNTTRETIP